MQHTDARLPPRPAAALLAADLALSADGEQHSASTPSLTLGYRGAVALRLHVTTAAADLHSGSFGGSVPNAAHVLAALLAALHVPGSGAVAAPGFYDVAPLTEAERAAFAAVPFDEAADREAAGADACGARALHAGCASTHVPHARARAGGAAPFGEPGFTTLERRWCAAGRARTART